jgi:hypothetical protein
MSFTHNALERAIAQEKVPAWSLVRLRFSTAHLTARCVQLGAIPFGLCRLHVVVPEDLVTSRQTRTNTALFASSVLIRAAWDRLKHDQ